MPVSQMEALRMDPARLPLAPSSLLEGGGELLGPGPAHLTSSWGMEVSCSGRGLALLSRLCQGCKLGGSVFP